MPKPLANAGRFLTTGHPAYRKDWTAFMSSIHVSSTDDTDQLIRSMVSLVPALTPELVTRSIIRSLNGLHPLAPSRPRPTS